MLVWLHGNGYPGPQPVKGGLAPRLKPALEPILLARKPFGGTLGSNLSTYGTGALNIDATRIINHDESCPHSGRTYRQRGAVSPKGRWPANLILSHGSRCRPTQCQRDCPVDLLGTHHRFFYCPKAAQGEREAGCERLPRRTIQTFTRPSSHSTSCAGSCGYSPRRDKGREPSSSTHSPAAGALASPSS
jgi:hypothetical protein